MARFNFFLGDALSNLQLLKREPLSTLLATVHGKIEKSSLKQRLYHSLRCLLKGKGERHWLHEVIFFSFSTLCHEMRHPLEPQALERLFLRTVCFCQEVLTKIREEIPFALYQELEQLIQRYRRQSLHQLHLLKKIQSGVVRHATHPLVQSCQRALKEGVVPKQPSAGCSGSYLIPHPCGTVLAIFKPFDEEIGACHNPQLRRASHPFGEYGRGAGLISGTSIHREIAATVVDEFLGLGLVPVTVYAALTHALFYSPLEGDFLKVPKEKWGSLQLFRPNLKHIVEISPKGLMGISLDDIHRLILLDMIIGNLDRNSGNLLTDGKRLVAIDHGLSFSQRHRSYSFSHFHKWSQLHAPFLPSLAQIIMDFPVEELQRTLLEHCFLEVPSLNRMKERIALLKSACRAGKTVYEIISLFDPKILALLLDLSRTLAAKADQIVASKRRQ